MASHKIRGDEDISHLYINLPRVSNAYIPGWSPNENIQVPTVRIVRPWRVVSRMPLMRVLPTNHDASWALHGPIHGDTALQVRLSMPIDSGQPENLDYASNERFVLMDNWSQGLGWLYLTRQGYLSDKEVCTTCCIFVNQVHYYLGNNQNASQTLDQLIRNDCAE